MNNINKDVLLLRQLVADYDRLEKDALARSIISSPKHELSKIKNELAKLLLQYSQNISSLEGLLSKIHFRNNNALFETIESSKTLLYLAIEIGQILDEYCTVGFLCGSMAYGLFYNVKQDSDIDIIVIVDDLRWEMIKLPLFKDYTEELKNGIIRFKTHDFIELGIKIVYNEAEVSLHFTRKSLFEKICELKYTNSGVMAFRSFRTKPRPDGDIYFGRYSFDGCEHIWRCDSRLCEDGVDIESPVFQIDAEGRFVSSFLLDRYLIAGYSFGNAEYLNTNLLKIKSSLVERLIYEEHHKIVEIGTAFLYKIFSRQNAFPEFYIQDLLQQEQNIRKGL